MTFKPFTIDDSFDPTAVGSAKPYCTPGNYLLEIAGIGASPEAGDADKFPYWRWQFTLAKGPSNVGRSFPHVGSWKEGAQFGNARILGLTAAFDATKLRGNSIDTQAKLETFTKQIAERVKGKLVGAYIADGDPYKGRPSSEILEFFKADEYEQRAAAAAASPPQSPNGPAGSAAAPSVDVAELFEGLKL